MPPYIAPEEDAVVGYWGRPTSTLDWCEENHLWTPYVAEFWNTLSNMAMVLPGLIGMWSSAKNGLELRYFLCYFGLFVVGVGSTLFHGTLLYSMQLLDELPMLICTSFLLFALYEMGHLGNWNTRSYLTAAFLTAYPTTVSMAYISINDPTFHEVAYGLMVVLVTVQGFYCIRKYSSWKHSAVVATLSMSLYVFGFILWNIDNAFCSNLRNLRHSQPLLGPLSQFHSWWHTLAGLGTYLHIVLSSRVRMEYLQNKTRFKFLCGLPLLEVERKGE